MPADKLQPRNRTARLAAARASGNPVVVELEASVGNCFPGLELDLRNLDRRFFPYLSVDFVGGAVAVAGVALAAAQSDPAAAPMLPALQAMAAGGQWAVTRLAGEFAGFGQRSWTTAQLAQPEAAVPPTRPPDPWTAVRLLLPGRVVQIEVRGPNGRTFTLSGTRASYLSDDGAFAPMFEPGELTQSLCSPWTHDFRDCGCWYWASNHPDIVQPAVPNDEALGDPAWSNGANWLRAARGGAQPPPSIRNVRELAHHEINNRWEELDIVLDGREQRTPYRPGQLTLVPIPAGALVAHLRYAAGVELAVTLEYLAAYYSLNAEAGTPNSTLRDDVRAARGELLRVAISEMTHLASVNRILAGLHRRANPAQPFAPALGVAARLPRGTAPQGRSVQFRPLTLTALDDFIAIEAPSDSVDGLYLGILGRLEADGLAAEAAAVRSIIADGTDHYATFRDMREWLSRHPESSYLRVLQARPGTDPDRRRVQDRYVALLTQLERGYRAGLPAGAADIAAARLAMVEPGGLDEACRNLAARGGLIEFDTPGGAAFTPVDQPPAPGP